MPSLEGLSNLELEILVCMQEQYLNLCEQVLNNDVSMANGNESDESDFERPPSLQAIARRQGHFSTLNSRRFSCAL